MLEVLKTPFNYMLMKKHSNITVIITLIFIFTFTYVIESVYSYKLTSNLEEHASSGEYISDTKFFYEIEDLDVSLIHQFDYKIVNNQLSSNNEEIQIFEFELKNENKLLLIFDSMNEIFYQECDDVAKLYEYSGNYTYCFAFGKEEIYYQHIGEEKNIINYNYLYFDFNQIDNLNEFGKLVSFAFTQVYIDYRVSEFTVVAILMIIIFPIILTWILFKFSSVNVGLDKFKQFFNVMIYSSFLPFIITLIATLFFDQAVYFYDILLFVFYVYNIYKISKIKES